MNVLLRNAKIIDTESSYHNQSVDVLIENGNIKKIGIELVNNDNYQEVALPNLHLSQGWFDMSVSLGEPGFEDCETIANGLVVAAKSGFTAIALQPNSLPVIDNQSQVHFIKSKSFGFATQVYPIGALTVGSLGQDMAELFDMKNAGAVAYGDYNKSIENPNLLKIALQYTQDFEGLIIAFSQDQQIKGSGIANEGIVATRLGLKGIPSLAEELQLARNLFILEYTGGKLHIPTISTAKSVALIKEAKAKGLQVSCSVAVHHLALTDEKLENFDTRYKVTPPLRTEIDRLALIQGVLDNTIDAITSDHNPVDIEHKKMEFDKAKYGTIGLESAFGVLHALLPLEVVVKKLTAARAILGLASEPILEGNIANLSLFNPETNTVFTTDAILSKSKNSAFLQHNLQGKVYGSYNQSQLTLNQNT